MLVDAPLLSALEDVAEHGPPGRRAEILKHVTNLFVEGANAFTEEHVEIFDEVFDRLIAEIEAKARAELSVRLAAVGNAPPRVVLRLAQDDNISVAGPVLQHSERLKEPDLLDVAKRKSQEHLLAIANRNQIAESVTDVVVRRGNREVVRDVAGNPGAHLSEAGFSTLVRKAEKDGILAEKVGLRADIPQPLFRELLVQATQVVQRRLFVAAKPETQAEIRRVLAEISSEIGTNAAPRDYAAAQQAISKIQRAGKLDEAAIATSASEGRYEETVAGLSALCKVPIQFVHRLMASDGAGPVLTVCRAAGFTWPTVRAIILVRTNGRGMSSHSLETTYRDFERLSASTARRIVRFWHARYSAYQATGTAR
jgi:uncharacterized protein (DUF2336 family)